MTRYATVTLTENEMINIEVAADMYCVDIEAQLQRTIAKMKAARQKANEKEINKWRTT